MRAVCSYYPRVPFLRLATCPVKIWFACLPPCYPCLWPELPLKPESLELLPSYSPSGHLARHAISSCPGITSSGGGPGAVGAEALSWVTRAHLRTCLFSPSLIPLGTRGQHRFYYVVASDLPFERREGQSWLLLSRGQEHLSAHRAVPFQHRPSWASCSLQRGTTPAFQPIRLHWEQGENNTTRLVLNRMWSKQLQETFSFHERILLESKFICLARAVNKAHLWSPPVSDVDLIMRDELLSSLKQRKGTGITVQKSTRPMGSEE